jgi:hypothetical protein
MSNCSISWERIEGIEEEVYLIVNISLDFVNNKNKKYAYNIITFNKCINEVWIM